MSRASVLFIINGFGLGNATRCEGAMDLLRSKYDIDIITSDRALTYFRNNEKVRHLFSQADINLQSRFAYGTFRFFLAYAIYFFPRLWKNYRIQNEITKKNSYDIIFVDSDYSFVFHRLSGKRNLVGINNAFEVVQFFKKSKSVKSDLWCSFLVELTDYLICRFFLDFVICPAISWKNLKLKTTIPKNILVCPPLARDRLFKRQVCEDGGLLVTGSSSGEKSPLHNFAHMASENFSLIGKFEKDNISLLHKASVIFCNAGQSSIAECLYLGKKALLFPIPKHSEQFANASLAAEEGLMVYGGQSADVLLADIRKHYTDQNNIIPIDYGPTQIAFLRHIADIEKKLKDMQK